MSCWLSVSVSIIVMKVVRNSVSVSVLMYILCSFVWLSDFVWYLLYVCCMVFVLCVSVGGIGCVSCRNCFVGCNSDVVVLGIGCMMCSCSVFFVLCVCGLLLILFLIVVYVLCLCVWFNISGVGRLFGISVVKLFDVCVMMCRLGVVFELLWFGLMIVVFCMLNWLCSCSSVSVVLFVFVLMFVSWLDISCVFVCRLDSDVLSILWLRFRLVVSVVLMFMLNYDLILCDMNWYDMM